MTAAVGSSMTEPPASSHWSDEYLRRGLKYQAGVFECTGLVEMMRREVFGHALALPTGSLVATERSTLIARHMTDFVVPTNDPQDGDGVLLMSRGRSQHIGLYCQIAGEGWVIHNLHHWNVTRHRVRELRKWHMTIEGYYQWI
jgi:hypothetical protein